MANKSLFQSLSGKLVPQADATNKEGAPAYAYTPRHGLAQLAATGCLNQTFYAGADAQLADVVRLASEVEPEFLARCAIYARQRGTMKDMPALLLAVLSVSRPDLLAKAFPRVVDNGRMVRNFVQILRSGATGRKSLGSRPKALVQAWLNQASDVEILRASVGQSPSLADIVKMVHPKPASKQREALYAYLIGKPYDVSLLPQLVRDFEAFKLDRSLPLPDVPFQMLTALELSKEQWARIAERAGWQMIRMNLNTFARHGVYEVEGFTQMVARRLADPKEVRRAKVLPYQLMMAHAAAGEGVPNAVREALQDAMEVAIANVPAIAGAVVVAPDVSGSMGSPVTGFRKGATSKVRCIDVAALVAAAFLRKNVAGGRLPGGESPATRIMPFEQKLVEVRLNPRDTVLTNAAKLAAVGGGGTNCSAPLQKLVAERAKGMSRSMLK